MSSAARAGPRARCECYGKCADDDVVREPTLRVPPAGKEGTIVCPSQRPEAAVKTARERADEKREAKLESVREQVESGSLVIRQMTDEERRRYPPVPARTERKHRVRW